MAEHDNGEEYTAEAQPLESFSLTVPHLSGPRSGPIRGLVVRTWLLPPAAAQAFEESLRRHQAQVRTQLRIYRGTRELLPEIEKLGEEVPSVPPPPTREATPADAVTRGLEQHLVALNRSIEVAQQRLERIEAEVVTARERRDKELGAMQQLVESAQSSALRQIQQSRDHAIEEQGKAFALDKRAGDQFSHSWNQVTETAATVATARNILGQSVLADRMEKYLTIGQALITGVAESEVGRLLGLKMAQQLATLANKSFGDKSPTGQPFSPDDVLLAALLQSSMFAERRRLLGQYSVVGAGPVGQALILGPDFCLGRVAPEAIEELVTTAAAQRGAVVAA